MIAQLQRSGNNSYALSDKKLYDAWGSVRWSASAANGEPKTRYCGNLGHVQDDDSGLIYMRARYYEPGTGRFVSEDQARDGGNWFRYCANQPINGTDPSGNVAELLISSFIDQALEAKDATMSLLVKQWGENKVQTMMSYHMGILTGMMMSVEWGLIDVAGDMCAIIGDSSGNRIVIDFAHLDHRSYKRPHFDLLGPAFKHLPSNKFAFLKSFFDGFKAGFF